MRARRLLIGLALLAAFPAGALAQDVEYDPVREGMPGHKLYVEKCAVCHGENGEADGPAAKTMLPRPRVFLDNANYKFRTTTSGALPTRDDIFRVITDGVHGTAMPSFKHLSEADRWKLVDYIETFTEEFRDPDYQTDRKPLPMGKAPKVTKELVEKGRQVYDANGCRECHGAQARGDGTTWADKKDDRGDPIVAANLQRWHQLRCGDTIQCLFRATQTGLNGTPMPNYDIPESDRWALAAFLKSLQQPKKKRQDQIIVAKLMKELPETADDERWEKAPQSMFFMFGQIVQKPRLFWPSVTEVFVRAVYNDEEIVFLVEWDDRDVSLGKNLTEYDPKLDPIGDIMIGTDHPDQMALQFPTGLFPAGKKERPYFLWGDQKNDVDLWWWGTHLGDKPPGPADVGGFRDRNASGTPDSIVDQDPDSQELRGVVTYPDCNPQVLPKDKPPPADCGRYRMVIRRALRTPNPKDVQFESGLFTPIAFNIWQGSRGEVGMRRAVSAWYLVVLEPPVPKTVFIPPVIAGGVTFAVLLLIVLWVRRQPPPKPASQRELGTLGEATAGEGEEVPPDERLSGWGLVAGIATLVLVISLIRIGVKTVVTTAAESEKDQIERQNSDSVQKLKTKQGDQIHNYEWVDETKGTTKIPIERAMDLVVEDAKQGKDTLVPAVGKHNKPTLPPKFGRQEEEKKDEGAAPPADGTAPPADGAAPPADGTTPPADGAAPPAGGTTPPAGGATPPAGGTTPPAAGNPAPAGGNTPPAGGTTPPAGNPPAGGNQPKDNP